MPSSLAPTKSSQLTVAVTIDGNPVTLVPSFVQIESVLNAPTQLLLVFDKVPRQDVLTSLGARLGSRLVLSIVDENGGGAVRERYRGTIEQIDESTAGVKLIGRGDLARLAGGPECRTFVDLDLGYVLSKLLSPAGSVDLKVRNLLLPTAREPNVDTLSFACRLAAKHGVHIAEEQDALAVFDDAESRPLVSLTATEVGAMDLSVSTRLVPCVGAVAAYSCDPASDVVGHAPVTSPNPLVADSLKASQSHYPLSCGQYSTSADVAQDQVDSQASAQVRAACGQAVRAMGAIHNRSDLRAGRRITFTGHHRLQNALLIHRATHQFAPLRGFTTSFEAGSTDGLAPTASVARLQHAGPTLGIVDKNDDPAGLGRVLVRLQRGDETPVWVRCLATAGGGASGWSAAFTPSIGSKVVVTYLDGDPEQPVLLGCLPDASTTAPFVQPNGVDEVLVLRSPRGTEIRVVAGDQEDEVRINAGGSRFVLKGKADAPFASIEQDGGHRFVLDGKSKALIVESAGDLEFRSKGKMVFSAEKELEASAAEVSIKAKSKVSSKGASVVTEASGEVAINGAIVRIN
jgi:uncharacterized protein involved in type VI secretion and phage assembly